MYHTFNSKAQLVSKDQIQFDRTLTLRKEVFIRLIENTIISCQKSTLMFGDVSPELNLMVRFRAKGVMIVTCSVYWRRGRILKISYISFIRKKCVWCKRNLVLNRIRLHCYTAQFKLMISWLMKADIEEIIDNTLNQWLL